MIVILQSCLKNAYYVSERVLLDFPWIRETLQKACSDDNPESQKKENLSYTKPVSKHKQEKQQVRKC